MKKVLKTAFWMAAAVFCTGGAFGQANLPPTIDIPVTFYDFRSDRSNPEFEQPHGKGSNNGHWTGMVANQLDADNKPQLGPTPYRNYGIRAWFRDWNAGGPYAKGSTQAPVYTPAPAIRQTYSNEWDVAVTLVSQSTDVGHDTSFKNIVIPGNLTFTLASAATGMYRYDNSSFFPLDARGFGNEWNSVDGSNGSHNYAFTMEMEFDFQVKAGMTFNFRGDDDVWVFIDKTLVLDLGGIHERLNGNFSVETALGAGAVGSNRTLRVFYAERHSSGSNLLIETNIVAPPAAINISETGNDGGGIISGSITKPADEKKTLYSVIYDDNGVVLKPGEYDCNHVTWTITAPNGQTTTQKGCSIELADSIAGSVGIKVVYNNGTDPSVTKNASMNVNALPPATVRIQLEDGYKLASDNVYFNPGVETQTAYAVLYDKYGNYAGLANSKQQGGSGSWYSDGSAQWRSEDQDVATVNPANGSSTTVRKEFMGEGTESKLIVSFRVCGGTLTGCVTLSDTVGVGSKSVGAVSVGPPFVPGVTGALEPYQKKDPGSAAKMENFYRDVLSNSSGRGKGVLIGVDAPKPLEESRSVNGSGVKTFGKVTIYDAVGNVVMSDALIQAGAARSYGYVWDGRNQKGRYVGPGTYLVRVSGRDADKTPFSVQKKVGVTTSK